jgi:hypothetical protein
LVGDNSVRPAIYIEAVWSISEGFLKVIVIPGGNSEVNVSCGAFRRKESERCPSSCDENDIPIKFFVDFLKKVDERSPT